MQRFCKESRFLVIFKNKKELMGNNQNNSSKVSKDFIEMRGLITELLPAGSFRVKLENDQEILGYLSGRMRMNKIRLAVGDQVRMELTPYDLSKGRITFRY